MRRFLLSIGVIALLGSATASFADDQLPLPAGLGNASFAPGDSYKAAAAEQELKGLFKLERGECSASGATGTYFQMIDRAGSPISNTDSVCADKSFNPLTQGKDKGLSTTGFQPHPAVVFDSNGNALSDRIAEPTKFFNVKFGIATNEVDPQTKSTTALPRILHDGAGHISQSSDLRAFAAAWNGNQASQTAGEGHYNQGAPKPDGSTPAATERPTGTFVASTLRFVIDWKSTIVGGAFDQNTGHWHLEGTFDPQVAVGDPPKLVTDPTQVKGRTVVRSKLATTGPPFGWTIGLALLLLGALGVLLGMWPLERQEQAILGSRREKGS